MITKITGKLVELGAAEATIEVGAFEYQILVPEFVRRRLQESLGESVSLRTIQYIDGNIQKGGRMSPRLIGFLSTAEQEFFEMICSVDGVGVKKALQAMVRPVRDVAAAIEEQDAKTLTTLPGIGPAVADRIIAKLRRKMTRFALMPDRGLPAEQQNKPDILADGYEALVALGHTPTDARKKIEAAVAAKGKFKSVDELINEVYRQEHG
jgi:holliday junction DNA helicase RuvA